MTYAAAISDDDILLERERRRRRAPGSRWEPGRGVYVNRQSGKPYRAHHADEARFVGDDAPRRMLAKGGEGGGKSVAGIIKGLERLRRGMNGIMGSPDFEHFKRSLWPEFARWCPWGQVIGEQQYRSRVGWEPTKSFTLTFTNGASLLCGGFDDPASWEGPNVSFAHFDEARRHRTPAMLKVLDGRCRIPGPQGEPPQLWLTTTPRKHWLYEYFGPWGGDGDDPFGPFKGESFVIDLYTRDNEIAGNLDTGYTARRRQSLTEAEARVLLEAAWEDIDEADAFLSSMLLWDACRAPLPPLGPHEPCILALDAAESNDTFGTVIVSGHAAGVAARYVRGYVPQRGAPLDFDEIEIDVRELGQAHAIQELAYDPMLLGQLIRRLRQPARLARKATPDLFIDFPAFPAPCVPFPQGAARLEADKGLLDVVQQRRFAHDGDAALRQHIANANRKVDGDGRRLRIVKRTYAEKIDLAVALSMAVARWFGRRPLSRAVRPIVAKPNTWNDL